MDASAKLFIMTLHRASIETIECRRALLAPLFGVQFFFRANPGVFAALDPRLLACTPIRGATSRCPSCDSGFSLPTRSNDGPRNSSRISRPATRTRVKKSENLRFNGMNTAAPWQGCQTNATLTLKPNGRMGKTIHHDAPPRLDWDDRVSPRAAGTPLRGVVRLPPEPTGLTPVARLIRRRTPVCDWPSCRWLLCQWNQHTWMH